MRRWEMSVRVRPVSQNQKEDEPMGKESLELRRRAAREKRYQKAIVRELNIDTIKEKLADMMEECSDVSFFVNGVDESLLNELIGNEDEAFEFRMMFSALFCDVEKMLEDLNECYDGSFAYQMSQHFDDFFASIKAAAAMGGGMMGYDPEEQDYFPLELSIENDLAVEAAANRMKRLTKNQIIEAAQFNFRIAFSYIGIKTRYDNLKDAIDILRGENAGFLQQVKAIEAAYEEMAKAGFYKYADATLEFDRMIAQLPDESWIQ